MKFILKTLFWIILCLFYWAVLTILADYWDWIVWQKILVFLGAIGATLLGQWLWRRRRLRYHLKLLSISDTTTFNVEKSWQAGLSQSQHESQLSKKKYQQRPWYIGISFSPLTTLQQNARVILESNSTNVHLSIVTLDNVSILLFEFTSRLLLDREIELYKSYLHVFNKTFSKTLLGQLCFFHAHEFATLGESTLLDIRTNFSKLNELTTQVTEKNLPVTLLFHQIEAIPAYQDFLIRLAKKTKEEAFGWQAEKVHAYEKDEWLEVKQDIWQQLLIRCEQAFMHHPNIDSIESYQFLTHIKHQLDQLQNFFGIDSTNRIILSGIYWLGTLVNLSTIKSTPFTQVVFEKHLPRPKIKAEWIPKAAIAIKQRLHTYLSIYWLLALSTLAYVGISYQETTRIIIDQLQQFPKTVYFHHQLDADLNSLSMYQTVLTGLNEDQQNHWLSLFPFRAGVDQLQNAYTSSFLSYFQRYTLIPMDAQLQQALDNPQVLQNEPLRILIITHLMHRLNLVNAKLLHLPLDKLTGPSVWATAQDPTDLFSMLYKTYIQNNDSIPSLQNEHDHLINLAKQLNLTQENFEWLPAYIDAQIPDSTIYLGQLWGGSKPISLANAKINSSYTLDGSLAVIDFWKNFNQAFSPIADFSKQQKDFYLWHQNMRYTQWSSFLMQFSNGYLTFNNQGEWDDAMNKISNSNRGPYQFIFKLIGSQFTDEISQRSEVTQPSWLTLGKRFNLVLNYDVHNDRAIRSKGVSATLQSFIDYTKQKKSTIDAKRTLSSIYYDKVDRQQLAANDFYAYSQALALLQSTALLPEQAYTVSKAIYGGNNATFNDALNKEAKVENQFISLQLQESIFWRLVRGPLEFYVRYCNLLSNSYINDTWQLNVLAKTQDIPAIFLNNLLFGDNGIFWDFYNKYLGDYLIIRSGMILPKFILNISYPFTESFYDLLNSASSTLSLNKQQALYGQYFDKQAANNQLVTSNTSPVASTLPNIVALPPTLNKEATTLPQQITLNVQCGKDNFELTNYNFPIKKTLSMPLSNCQKTTLSIIFNDFTLMKTYDNFLTLLDSIQNNSLNFAATDFPANTYSLNQYHITELTLNYQLNNFDGLIQQYRDYLNLQKSLLKHRKEYNSVTDLPVIIAANGDNQTSIREMLSTSNTGLWPKG